MSSWKSLLLVFSGAFCLIAYTFLVLIWSEQAGSKELFRSEQPESVSYGSFEPYVLTIAEGPIEWDTLGWPRSLVIGVTRSPGSSYGHFIEVSQTPVYNRDFEVEWNEWGLIVRFPSGHNLEIPKELFIGGR